MIIVRVMCLKYGYDLLEIKLKGIDLWVSILFMVDLEGIWETDEFIRGLSVLFFTSL